MESEKPDNNQKKKIISGVKSSVSENTGIDKNSTPLPSKKTTESKKDKVCEENKISLSLDQAKSKLAENPIKTEKSIDTAKGQLPSSSKMDTSFELCEKLVAEVKLGNQIINNIFKNILNIFSNKDEDPESRQLKFDLLETLMDNLKKANIKELQRVKDCFTELVLPASLAKFIIDVKDIKMPKPIGPNFYGHALKSVVFNGHLIKNGRTYNVAIKFSKKPSIRKEAIILSKLNHPNVVKLLGVDQDVTMIVLEYMDGKDIFYGLTHNTIDSSVKNLMKILLDVSTGMEYIHSQNILHRDLDIYNVFFNQKNEFRIGDFEYAVYVGDSNGVYLSVVEEQIPTVLKSPESRTRNKYTFKTDVWAMGILCWSIFNVPKINDQKNDSLRYLFEAVQTAVSDPLKAPLKARLRCPQMIYSYAIEKLLHINPSDRPNFSEIKTVIQNMKF